MNKFNFFTAAIFGTCFCLPAHADVRVLVKAEHAGTDILYRYTLVNNGPGNMMRLAIGVTPDGGIYPSATVPEVNSYGTLSRLPTGTTFAPDDADGHFGPSWMVATYNPASVSVPAQPAGWLVERAGPRGDHPRSVSWKAPLKIYSSRGGYNGLQDVTGANAGQTLSGFSVRVPADSATGPGAVGALAPYTTGEFSATIWMGTTSQEFYGRIEKQDVLPPVLSVTITPSTMRAGSKLLSATAAITVTDNYDPASEIKLESIVANQTLKSGDISEATFGTDDRAFKLKPVVGRVYTATYSATDGSGNKATASATVTVRK